MNKYKSFGIHQRINFKAYWLNPYHGIRYVFKEAELNPSPYHKNSPFPSGW
jgi:hypothetical protein